MRNKAALVALRTAAIYAIASAVWISFSDQLLARLVHDPKSYSQWSMLKGVGFVAVTALLLYLALRRQLMRVQAEAARREQTQAHLLESQNQQLFLAFLLEKSDQPLAIAYADGRIGMINHAFCELVGYSTSELKQLNWATQLTPPEWHETEARFLAELKRTGQPVRYEKEYIRKDGRRIPIELLVHETADQSGQGRCYYAFVTDISKRKQAELSLRESEARLSKFFRSSPMGIIITRFSDSRILEVNDAFAKIYGCTPADLVGRTVLERGLWADLVERERMLDELRAHGRCAEFEARFRRGGNGAVGFMLISAEIIELDREPCVLALVQDITARRHADERLRHLSCAVEQSPVSIVITNLSGNIEYVNPKFCEVTGYTLDEVRGRNPRILKSGEMPAEKYRQLWQTLSAGQDWRGEFHNRRKNGELFWESATLSAIKNEAGRATHYLAVKEDITERKRLEEQLRQAQKMDSIGHLAGGVAHDFNNLLAVIQGHTDLLGMLGALNQEQQESAAEIKRASERAASLTRQLLLFSRRQTLQLCDLDLNEIVTGITKMLRRIVGEDIEIQCHYAPRPLLLHADAGMLDQILLNLTVNSRDAMPEGGKLIIKTGEVTLTESMIVNSREARPGSYVCLTLSDSGHGIAPEVLPHIFEPFFTTKEVGKGTGLGLATVFGIVQQHHGWIDVESEMGKGTTFKVYLPELPRASSTALASDPDRATQRGGTETILLVEDDTAMRAMARLALTRLGYEVLEARSGQEAIDRWSDSLNSIQLVLTDLVMPGGKSGLELARTFTEKNPKLRVIYISGYSPEIAGKDVALREGINFLAKPFTHRSLAEIVRSRLDQPAS